MHSFGIQSVYLLKIGMLIPRLFSTFRNYSMLIMKKKKVVKIEIPTLATSQSGLETAESELSKQLLEYGVLKKGFYFVSLICEKVLVRP